MNNTRFQWKTTQQAAKEYIHECNIVILYWLCTIKLKMCLGEWCEIRNTTEDQWEMPWIHSASVCNMGKYSSRYTVYIISKKTVDLGTDLGWFPTPLKTWLGSVLNYLITGNIFSELHQMFLGWWTRALNTQRSRDVIQHLKLEKLWFIHYVLADRMPGLCLI